MSERASTLIVGGGIVGAAVAYFLAERRETDVVLLERGELGSGTTAGGLGGIRHQFVDELDVRLSMLAAKTWRVFDELTGAHHDFRQRGYLFLANTDAGLAELRAAMPLYERVGVNVEMVDPVTIADLVPGMRVDDLRGGRLGAEDGYGDPLQALAGFAAFAQLGGVRLREHVTVRDLLRTGDRVTGVRTDAGDITADRVLLATGC
ncbi:MAG TPA: FAD-binding oxidoreductase, partial [Candidatus Limnocylindria bacterium]|nr:FAD-binding oxidoreductase [Candidatus Limnocylindria bacterium]